MGVEDTVLRKSSWVAVCVPKEDCGRDQESFNKINNIFDLLPSLALR